MSDTPPHPARIEPQRLLDQCDITRGRARGPGGQHRNKVETAVELRHRPSAVTAQAGERRSQAQNQRVALFRLRINLALDVRSPYQSGAEPSELWRSRCRNGRIAVNPKHADFPAILAEALDVLAALHFDTRKAAAVLNCTATQLVNLLKHEPRALQQLNAHRRASGQRALQ